MSKKKPVGKKKPVDIFDANLENIDPELYSLLTAASTKYNSSVDLRPNTSAMLPHLNEILTSKVLDQQIHNTVASTISSITGFEFVNPIPESRHEAYDALLPLFTDGNFDASIVCIKFLEYVQDGKSVSIWEYLKRDYKNIEVMSLTPDQINKDEIKQQIVGISPTLIVVDLSMCPCKQDLTWIRSICEEINAKLIVDISHFLGLAIAGLYPFYEKLADVVIGNTFATLGGPLGAIVFSNKYANMLKPLMDVSEDDDINREGILAKLASIKFASDIKNKKVFNSMIENAKIFSKTFNDLGYKTLCNSDNYLVVLELADDMGYAEYVQLLSLAGVLVEGGRAPRLGSDNSEKSASLLFLGTSAISIKELTSSDVRKIAHIIDNIINPYPTQIKNAKKAIFDIVSGGKKSKR